jgi:t-SNARE complex subunit (syntaxin)
MVRRGSGCSALQRSRDNRWRPSVIVDVVVIVIIVVVVLVAIIVIASFGWWLSFKTEPAL